MTTPNDLANALGLAPRPRRAWHRPSALEGRTGLVLIAGPCMLESRELALRCADRLARLAERMPVIFKSSYDKANRSTLDAPRGPGLDAGLRILETVRDTTGLPVLTDVHTPDEAHSAGEVLDVLQVPAFLCRQTDLLVAAGRTGRPIQVKKGQFLPPDDARWIAEKAVRAGAPEVWLCERGSSFGHGDLVVDMRGLTAMGHALDDVVPNRGRVVIDATHSVQQRSGRSGSTGGLRALAATIARAAVAVGVDAVFAEVHPDPERALSDAATQLPLDRIDAFVAPLLRLDQALRAPDDA